MDVIIRVAYPLYVAVIWAGQVLIAGSERLSFHAEASVMCSRHVGLMRFRPLLVLNCSICQMTQSYEITCAKLISSRLRDSSGTPVAVVL